MRDGERDEKRERAPSKGEEKGETVKAVRGGRRKEGGMSPMAATHHSQLNDAIFFPLFPASFPWERLEGGCFQPASNQMGSNRVHILQVGPRKLRRRSRTRRDEPIGTNLLFKEPIAFSAEGPGRRNS